MTLIVDANVLVAVMNRRDKRLIAIAERLGVPDIATADNHFRAVRTSGLDFINVLP